MKIGGVIARLASGYGMFLALLGLCIFFSAVTVVEQYPEGGEAAQALADKLGPATGPVLIVVRNSESGKEMATALEALLKEKGVEVLDPVMGQPADVRAALESRKAAGGTIRTIACDHLTRGWGVVENAPTAFPELGIKASVEADSYTWPNFLKRDNLRNIASQISVIAILAIGMTMVIITGGIDLSVGSLIALAAVSCTLLIRDYAGGVEAGVGGVLLCCGGAILICALCGLFSGVMATFAGVPSFIVTLAIMLVAKGLAGVLSDSASINQVPPGFDWLGMQTSAGIPNSVILMVLLYIIAHVLMSYTSLGRHIYAVGGNKEAARLSGVPVQRVSLFVFVVCGALAGLGGVLLASQLKSGAMTYGVMYELYVIAAVVVGGTSLAGGEGRILGTLIGAFIIGVIRNGMNLLGLTEFTQMIVLGLVILAAVLLDSNKHHLVGMFRRKRSA